MSSGLVLRFSVSAYDGDLPQAGDWISSPVSSQVNGHEEFTLGRVLAVMWSPESNVRTVEILLASAVAAADVHPE